MCESDVETVSLFRTQSHGIAWVVTLSFPYLASQEKASLRAWERLARMLVLNVGSPRLRSFLRDTAPKSSKGGAGVSGDHRRWQADCNRYAHALALSVYAVLVAPQHFPRISELVKKLKELSRRYETLRHNEQIFAAVASIIALGISSANKHTFHDHMKAALGNQSPHAVNHKTARDIVNGYYKTTNSFGELPLATFGSIIGLVSTDATTLEITKKPELKGHDILIEIDAAFDVIMFMLPEMLQGEGAASLQSPLRLQSQFQSPPSPVTQVQRPLQQTLSEDESMSESITIEELLDTLNSAATP